MKKVLITFLFLITLSCHKNKIIKPFAFIEKVEYIELDYEKQPVVIVSIKVNDSSILQKLKNMELKEFRIKSIKKEDRNYFLYETWKAPIKKENTFLFLIRTSYFSQNISDKKQNKKRIWREENIITALSGDIELIFDKDSICVKPRKDRKIIIQMLRD